MSRRVTASDAAHEQHLRVQNVRHAIVRAARSLCAEGQGNEELRGLLAAEEREAEALRVLLRGGA